MKSIFLSLVFLHLSLSITLAQIPRTISYQGVLAHSDGSFVADGNHTLSLNLYESASGGTPIYTEVQTRPVVKGIFNCIIGSVTLIPASISFDRAYFLGVSVDGGNELSPRTTLTSVPYALYAEHAGTAETFTHSGSGGAAIPGTIHGNVVLHDLLGEQYRDLSGVRVELEGTTYSTTTDFLGKWELVNIPPGCYVVRCSKPGFGFDRLKGYQFAGNGDGYIPSFDLSKTAVLTLRLDSVSVDLVNFSFILTSITSQPNLGGFVIAMSENSNINPLDSSNFYLHSWSIYPPQIQGSNIQQARIYELRQTGVLKPGKTYYAVAFATGRDRYSSYPEPISGQMICTSTGPPSNVVSFVMP